MFNNIYALTVVSPRFRESFVLDEDDYELLLDNNVAVPRKSMNVSTACIAAFIVHCYGWLMYAFILVCRAVGCYFLSDLLFIIFLIYRKVKSLRG